MGWQRLLGPSLARRLIAALLLAFVLVWIALLLLYWQRLTQGREAQVQRTVAQVLALLTPEQPAGEAALRVRTVDELSRQELRDAGQSTRAGFILRDLRHPDDPPVYIAEALQDRELRWTLDGACELQGRACINQARSNGRWELRRLSLPMGDGEVFAGIHQALLPLLGLSFPLILLPLWLGVRSGLAPLNRLSRLLAQRRPEDLSPLALDLRYRELQPLLGSLQGLFARLRGHLERERAFVEDAAHELRTPMALIGTQAHVLKRAVSEAEREQAGRQLDAAVERASHLVQQLLALARMEAATEPALQQLDAAEWLREQLLVHMAAADQAGIELSLDAPDHLWLQTEPQALASIVGNLVENALRYAGRGARLELLLRPGADAVELVVQDDGPGIAPAEQAQLFTRFHRGRQQGGPVSGSGLGLSIVQQACLRLGARLSLESPRRDLPSEHGGRGCAFRIRLPA